MSTCEPLPFKSAMHSVLLAVSCTVTATRHCINSNGLRFMSALYNVHTSFSLVRETTTQSSICVFVYILTRTVEEGSFKGFSHLYVDFFLFLSIFHNAGVYLL